MSRSRGPEGGSSFARAAAFGAVALGAAGCGAPGTRVVTVAEPGAIADPSAVSILGVYRDGRMSSEAWGDVAPRLARLWSGGACQSGFDGSFARRNPDLSSTIDDYARANGPTDELLGALGPAAGGRYVMVVTVAGHAPAPTKMTSIAESEAAAKDHKKVERGASASDELDLSALVFSVPERRSVATVRVRYGGSSGDEGYSLLGASLARLLPRTRCAGWDWATLDPAQTARALAP